MKKNKKMKVDFFGKILLSVVMFLAIQHRSLSQILISRDDTTFLSLEDDKILINPDSIDILCKNAGDFCDSVILTINYRDSILDKFVFYNIYNDSIIKIKIKVKRQDFEDGVHSYTVIAKGYDIFGYIHDGYFRYNINYYSKLTSKSTTRYNMRTQPMYFSSISYGEDSILLDLSDSLELSLGASLPGVFIVTLGKDTIQKSRFSPSDKSCYIKRGGLYKIYHFPDTNIGTILTDSFFIYEKKLPLLTVKVLRDKDTVFVEKEGVPLVVESSETKFSQKYLYTIKDGLFKYLRKITYDTVVIKDTGFYCVGLSVYSGTTIDGVPIYRNAFDSFFVSKKESNPINIKEIYSKTKVDVYPNPTTDNFTISIPNKEKYIFELFDMSGKLVLSKEVQSKKQISREGLPSGIYFYKVDTSTGKLVFN